MVDAGGVVDEECHEEREEMDVNLEISISL
jgi:hypothetical protein